MMIVVAYSARACVFTAYLAHSPFRDIGTMADHCVEDMHECFSEPLHNH